MCKINLDLEVRACFASIFSTVQTCLCLDMELFLLFHIYATGTKQIRGMLGIQHKMSYNEAQRPALSDSRSPGTHVSILQTE